MELKILQTIKNFIQNKTNTQDQNNSKQKNIKYVRNKYGFFSPENKENKTKIKNLNK
tara:strand:+ start:60 stop:230 length:171 start_codon:yes stop_codon:yes gene_type:complete